MNEERIKNALTPSRENLAEYAVTQRTDVTVITPDGTPLEVAVDVVLTGNTIRTLLQRIKAKITE